MTLKEAKKIVKDLGLRLDYDSALREYTVYTPYHARDAYYTDDRQDAVDTARAMAATKLNTEPRKDY